MADLSPTRVVKRTPPNFESVLRYADADPMDPIIYRRTAIDRGSRVQLPRTSAPRPQQLSSHDPLAILGEPVATTASQGKGHARTWLKSIRGAKSQSLNTDPSPTPYLASHKTRIISSIRQGSRILDTAETPIGTSDLHTVSKPSYQHLRLDLTHSDTSFPSPTVNPVAPSELQVVDHPPTGLDRGSPRPSPPPMHPSLTSTSTLPMRRKSQKLVRILQPISRSLNLGRKPRSRSSARQRLSIAVTHSTMLTQEHSEPSAANTSPSTATSDAPSSLMPAAPRPSSETSHPPSRVPSPQPEAEATNPKGEVTSPIQVNPPPHVPSPQPDADATNPRGEVTSPIQAVAPLSASLRKSLDRPLPPIPVRRTQNTSPALPPTHRRPNSSPTEYGTRRRTVSQTDLGELRETHVRFKRQKRPTTAPAAFPAPFQVNVIPSQRQLSAAASLTVIAENGVRYPFGDLFLRKKTVVVFIRHFWCPLCQDYVHSISRNVNPAVLRHAGVELVIISNGSHNMIKGYRKIFNLPFAVYTDPEHKVYNAIGMTLRSLDPGPDAQKGGYVRHGTVGGITMVVLNAIKVKMPVWEKGGDIEQLGGEFVLGPGLQCSFAHRMRSTRSHSPIQHVLAAAGVDICIRPSPGRASDETSTMSESEELQWMEERKRSLAKLRSKKIFRRGDCVYGGVDSDTEDTGASIAAGPSSDDGDAVSDLVFIAPEAPEAVTVAGEYVAMAGETEDACDACRGDMGAIDQFTTHRQSLTLASDGGLYDSSKSIADDVASVDSGAYWDYYADRDYYTDEA